MTRLAWLPLLILGPITGPLVGLAMLNLRAHRPILAAACLAGIGLFWTGGPALLAAELAFLHH